jgi:hypothetical protein
MNPEEFDKRLKQTFKTENLIPKEDLWENIASQIQPNQKKSFWLYFTPIILAVVVSSAAAYYFISDNKNNAIISSNNTEIQNPQLQNQSTEINQTNKKQVSKGIKEATGIAKTNTSESKGLISEKPTSESNLSSSKSKSKSPRNPLFNTKHQEIIKDATPSLFQNQDIQFDIFSISKIKFRKRFQTPLFNNELLKNETNPFVANNSNRKNKTNNESKWSLLYAVGPQLALNKVEIPAEHKAFVHKKLWDNQNQLTHNGTGFHTNLLLNYKFSKLFSLESGIEYGIRTEDIKLDISSDEIAIRNSSNNIIKYDKLKLLVIVINPDGTKDSTFYDAISSFNLAVNNKYHSITIPVNFKSEFKLSENTAIQLGIGGGFSYLFSKKTVHYDILNEKKVEEQKNRLFTSSLNTKITLLTNFNDIGRIGVYTGFQVYNTPWQVINNQYSIGMRDFQFGMTYQKPLNW